LRAPWNVVAIIVSLLALACQVSDPPVRILERKPGTNVHRPPCAETDDEHFEGLLQMTCVIVTLLI
jgi:hypothetical protein